MADIWFFSDPHFEHEAILKHTNRPYSNITNMNIAILYEIRNTVKKRDTVICLGDFIWKKRLIKSYAKLLPGKWTIIPGNHDEKFKGELSKYFMVTERLYHKKFNKKLFVLCHYPLDTWSSSNHGSIHLHGHSHGTLKTSRENRFDISWDVYKRLINLDEVLSWAK
jgi:calcineurin-like phosphoesterase family protein